MNLAGPRSRAVLAKLTAIDLSSAAFPYLGVREARWPACRCAFCASASSASWATRSTLPAEHAAHLWDALMEAGADLGIRPFGVEAQRLLRLEKGHIIIGQDTDGLTTPLEAALEWAVKMDKPFFVGQRSLRIIEKQARKHKLVGFALDKGFSGEAPKECHLVIRNGDIAGRVTSIAFSESARAARRARVRRARAGAGGHPLQHPRRRRAHGRSQGREDPLLRPAPRSGRDDQELAAQSAARPAESCKATVGVSCMGC